MAKKKNIGHETKESWKKFTETMKDTKEDMKETFADFSIEVQNAKREIKESLMEFKEELEENKEKRNYFIAGGVLGAVGMLISLGFKDQFLGVAVIGGASLIIAYGLYLCSK